MTFESRFPTSVYCFLNGSSAQALRLFCLNNVCLLESTKSLQEFSHTVFSEIYRILHKQQFFQRNFRHHIIKSLDRFWSSTLTVASFYDLGESLTLFFLSMRLPTLSRSILRSLMIFVRSSRITRASTMQRMVQATVPIGTPWGLSYDFPTRSALMADKAEKQFRKLNH